MITNMSIGLLDSNESIKYMSSEHFEPKKKTPLYTFVRELANNVCLCVDRDNVIYVAKYSRKTDQSLIKEIRLTQLLSWGFCDVATTNISLLKTQSNYHANDGKDKKDEDREKTRDCNEISIDEKQIDTSQLQKTCYSIYTFFANQVKYINQIICFFSCCMSHDDPGTDSDDDYDDIDNICDDVTNPENNINYIESLGDNIYKFKILNDLFNYDYFCRYVTTVASPEKTYLIMKYSGEDLCDHISNIGDRMHESYAKNIFKHIVLAIKTLHNIGIAHGDLSPENICIVNPNDKKNVNIYLIDYEFTLVHRRSPYYHLISNCIGHNERTIVCDTIKINNDYTSQLITKLKPYVTIKHIYGKQYYISPERINAHFESIKEQTSKRSYYCSYKDDIYALGIILFTMLSGQLPYQCPIKSDHGYNAIISGLWKKSIVYDGFTKNNSYDAVDLIDRILKPEKHRLSLDQILNHRWLTK